MRFIFIAISIIQILAIQECDKLFIPRSKKVNDKIITDHDIMSSAYAYSHGVTNNNLSTLQLLFSLILMYKPDNCVVIGTGTGLIPRIIREAQIKSGKEVGKTYLIDLGETNGAMPSLIHNTSSVFRQLYPDIDVYKNYSVPGGYNFIKTKLSTIDILWIDGDHSYEGSKNDFDSYSQLVTSEGLIFMHDIAPNGEQVNQPEWCGVHKTIQDIKANSKFEVLQLMSSRKNYLGMGLAIIRRIKI